MPTWTRLVDPSASITVVNGRQRMEAQRIELFFVDGRETLKRAAGVEFIERIVRSLHAAVEKIAGIGSLAVSRPVSYCRRRRRNRRPKRCWRR